LARAAREQPHLPAQPGLRGAGAAQLRAHRPARLIAARPDGCGVAPLARRRARFGYRRPAAVTGFPGWGAATRSPTWSGARQAHEKGGGLPRSALRPDPAAVRLRDPAGDVEPEADAAAGARSPAEAIEERRELMRGDPLAMVGDAHLHLVLAVDQADLDGRIGVAVLDRVAEQVDGELLDPRGIHLHRIGLPLHLQIHLAVRDLDSELLRKRGTEDVERGRAVLELEVPRLEQRKVQEVRDHPLEVTRADEDLLHALSGLLVQAGARQQARVGVDHRG